MTTTNDRNQVPAATVTTWEIDPKASRIEFTARMRLMFVMKVKVQGRFTDVSGTLTVDEREPANSQANVTNGAASLDTKLAARDKHLHSADFFDVEHYPTLTFTSRRIEVLDRRDFGLTWSRPQQKIVDEINVALSIEFAPVSSAV